MRTDPITWILKMAGLSPRGRAPDGKPATIRGWTTPKTPVEVLAESLLTDDDWLAAPGRLHRRGIAISWKRAIASRYPGMELKIDGRDRPLSIHEAYLLAKGVRHRLALDSKTAGAKPKPPDTKGEAVT